MTTTMPRGSVRARRLVLGAVMATLLALPSVTLAGVEPGLWDIKGLIEQKRADCIWAPGPTVTAETVAWPAKCTAKKKKSGSVLYTLTILDPFGVVADQCTEQVGIPKKSSRTVGCTMPNPGIPVG